MPVVISVDNSIVLRQFRLAAVAGNEHAQRTLEAIGPTQPKFPKDRDAPLLRSWYRARNKTPSVPVSKTIPRSPPRRTMKKQEAVRHLIHSAIRMVMNQEDAFAINVIAHSADKLLIDMAKRLGKPLALEMGSAIIPEYRTQFYAVYRETYNYFKHADKDHTAELPVSDIVLTNIFVIAACVGNYFALFNEYTDHMKSFYVVCTLMFPDMFVPSGNRPFFDQGSACFGNVTLAQFFADVLRGEYEPALPHFQREKAADLTDNEDFYRTRFSDLLRMFARS